MMNALKWHMKNPVRYSYWNSTRFADIVRGIKKPYALPLDRWDIWHDKVKKDSPIRYFLAEKCLPSLQKILYFFPDLHQSFKCIRSNLNNKSHCLHSPKFTPGVWSDLTDRILYCNFDSFAHFVESELMHEYDVSSIEELIESMIANHFNQTPIEETESSAIHLLDLYVWWKYWRPQKEQKIAELWAKTGFSVSFAGDRKHADAALALEEELNKDDTKMLTKLIKYRHLMYT